MNLTIDAIIMTVTDDTNGPRTEYVIFCRFLDLALSKKATKENLAEAWIEIQTNPWARSDANARLCSAPGYIPPTL